MRNCKTKDIKDRDKIQNTSEYCFGFICSARKEAQNGSSLPHNHNHRKVGKTSMKIEINDRKSKDKDDLIFLLPWKTCVDCTDS